MKLKDKKVLIIGLGLNGSLIANEFIKAGATVYAIDENDLIDKEDFANKIQLNDLKNISTYKYFTKKIISFGNYVYENYLTLRISKYFKLNDVETNDKRSPFHNFKFHAVNGRSNIWGRVSPRYNKEHFIKNGWPLIYKDLNKFYEKVEKKLILKGIKESHSSFNGKIKKINKFSKKLLGFKKIIEKNNFVKNFFVAPILNYKPGRWNPYLKEILRSKNLNLIFNSVCTRIIMSKKNVVKGVKIFNKKTKKIEFIYGDYVFLSSAPINNVKLLLNSKSKFHPIGIGNGFNMVGKKFTDHIKVSFNASVMSKKQKKFLLDPFNPNKNYENFYILINNKKSKLNFIVHGTISLTENLISMYSFAESDIDNKNKINLSRRLDSYGNKNCSIKFKWSKKEIETWKHQKNSIKLILTNIEKFLNYKFTQSKKDQLYFNKIPTPGLSHHESGGLIMGKTAKKSVVDRNCKVWGIKNLYVCDMSTFPNLSPFNPTLTSLAITLRVTNNLIKSLH